MKSYIQTVHAEDSWLHLMEKFHHKKNWEISVQLNLKNSMWSISCAFTLTTLPLQHLNPMISNQRFIKNRTMGNNYGRGHFLVGIYSSQQEQESILKHKWLTVKLVSFVTFTIKPQVTPYYNLPPVTWCGC